MLNSQEVANTRVFAGDWFGIAEHVTDSILKHVRAQQDLDHRSFVLDKGTDTPA